MIHVLFIFGLPAVAAFWAGKWADTRFDMYPWGSLLALLVSAIISWAIIIRMYIRLTKEWKQLMKEEEEAAKKEQEEKRKQLKDQE